MERLAAALALLQADMGALATAHADTRRLCARLLRICAAQRTALALLSAHLTRAEAACAHRPDPGLDAVLTAYSKTPIAG